jgi:hypothetical protein
MRELNPLALVEQETLTNCSPEWDLGQKIPFSASFQMKILFVKFAYAEASRFDMSPR